MSTLLEQIDGLIIEGRYDLPSSTMTAYHCGRELKGGRFDLRYAGSGEGMQALGPGVYFADKRRVAQQYCKLQKEPFLYTVEIPTDGLYYAQQGVPRNLRDKAINLYQRVAKEHGEWSDRYDEYRLPFASSLKYGPGSIGEMFKALGAQKTIGLLDSVGIKGLYARLGADNGFEISVFDPSIIKIVDVERATSQA